MQPSTDQSRHVEPIKFTGQAGEYFGIWFSNHALTWLTLGIYSAWAKVRTFQYFYGNTELAGGRFQFTANPLTILRSRIIAFALFILYIVTDTLNTTLANIVFFSFIIGYIAFAPILTVFVMSFRFRYSQWRGISFRFNRDFKGGYRVYLPPTLLIGALVLSLMGPFYETEIRDFLDMEAPVTLEENEELGFDDSADEESVEQESISDEPIDNGEPGDSQYSDTEEYSATDEYAEDDEYYSEDDYYDEDYDAEYDDEEYYEDDYYYDDEYYEDEEDLNPVLFIPSLVLLLIFLALLPYFDFINMRYLARNVTLGTAPFTYTASVIEYYKVYSLLLAGLLAFIGLWVAYIAFDIGSFMILLLLSLVVSSATQAYLKSQRFNLLLNNVIIDNQHRLQANVPFLGCFLLMFTNSIVIAITFGLMTPWAKVRTAAFFIQYSCVEVQGSLDYFVAQQQDESNALGEEIADVFDLDIG